MKKKTPSFLYIADEQLLLPKMVTMNRAARKAYPENPTQRIHPIRKDAHGNYYREDPNAVRKENERVRAAERRAIEALQRQQKAAKALLPPQKADTRDAAKTGANESSV